MEEMNACLLGSFNEFSQAISSSHPAFLKSLSLRAANWLQNEVTMD